mgnify:CR=1 FL=1
MRWDAVPPEYAAKAIKAKTLARRNRSRDNWYLLGGLLSAIVVLAAVLFFFPATFDDTKKWLIPFLIALGMGLGLIFRQLNPATNSPKCPSCAQDWTIREGKSVPLAQQMLTWDKCPGCGALMNDGLLQIAVDKHTRDNETPK